MGEKENSRGLMAVHIMENSWKITFKEKESIIGPMDVSMMANGKIIRWKAMEFLHGQMVDAMRAHTSTTKRKAMVTSTGPMVASTRVAGKMESNMESVLTPRQVGRPNRANCPTAKDFIGSQTHKD